MSLEIFNLHDYAVLIGEGFYPRSPMGTQSHVHKKYAEEKTDHEGKRQVLREPGERGEDMRMDQKIVSCAEQRPEEREQRADQSLDIPAPSSAQKNENSGQISPWIFPRQLL